MIQKITLCLSILLFTISLNGQSWTDFPQQDEELGLVDWYRSYPDALAKAKAIGKPIFILFQEVPGCSTCKNYGNNLLTHPHIVEAIETYFVPLAIHNNKGGDDGEILRKFGEPSWNNPVARIINSKSEKDITPRLNGRYDMESLVSTIKNGILASNNLVPEYLNLLYEEHSAKDVRETHFAMYCFWSGEKNLGKLDGVIATKAGFMNGAEVVKIKYDAKKLEEEKLIAFAANKQCADGVFSNDQREISAAKKLKINTKKKGVFRPDKEPKYYTFNSEYKYLPMTSLQALKVNTALSNKLSPDEYLSPRQIELLILIKSKKVKQQMAIDQDFAMTWNSLILQSQKSD